MFSFAGRIYVLLVVFGLSAAEGFAQSPGLTEVEPGLERAVRWKWWVEPSDARQWGLPLRAVPVEVSPSAPSPGGAALVAGQAGAYTVKRGDALILIARRHKVPLAVLKQVNNLENDTIRVGQVLRIPSLEEVAVLAPAAKPTPATIAPASAGMDQSELGLLTLQVFLDREQFSTGPINARRGVTFDKVLRLYQSARLPSADPVFLQNKAAAMLGGDPLTRYTLTREDFRFIATPQAERAEPAATAAKKPKKGAPPVVRQPRPSYEQLLASPLLAYRSPWEFVAERFHCDEAYLRKLNPSLADYPGAGSQFIVPKVIPFEIERSLDSPLQPEANPAAAITAAVLDSSLLQISRRGVPIAVMPLSIARPGLRGRGAWTVLKAIPRPRLATLQEPMVKPLPPTRIYGTATPTPTPKSTPVPTKQTLPPGPRNPAGVLWIELAREPGGEPLPFGLHGTSIPGHMATQESLGGLRLANWDIVRAARLLPEGTQIEWKQMGMLPGAAVPVAQPQ